MPIHDTSHETVSQGCLGVQRKEKSLLAGVFVVQVCLQGRCGGKGSFLTVHAWDWWVKFINTWERSTL